MDDPISALDAHVRKQVFRQVFQGLLKDKTRILVTHAIDFVHLADKVVIMKKGHVKAHGTYEDLRDNEYMKEVMDIHKEHIKENKKIAKEAQRAKEGKDEIVEIKIGGDCSSSDEDQESDSSDLDLHLANLSMTEEEIDTKLKVFAGKKNDPKYAEDLKNAGSLFDDEAKEQIEVTKETYIKVFKRSGGIVPFVVILGFMIFQNFWSAVEQHNRFEWGQGSFEEQQG